MYCFVFYCSRPFLPFSPMSFLSPICFPSPIYPCTPIDPYTHIFCLSTLILSFFILPSAPFSLLTHVLLFTHVYCSLQVIKTQVQTGQAPNVREAFETAKISNPKGVLGLWKHYPVMLWLDIPFQIINFILYGVVSDAVAGAGFTQSILTRLFCG